MVKNTQHPPFGQEERDLLIRLDQKVQDGFASLNNEILLLRDGTHKRISDLEVNKLDRSVFETYMTTTDKSLGILFKSDGSLKKLVYIGVGIVAAIQFITLIVATLK